MSTQEELTVERLAELLREAQAAHSEFERTTGERDEDWPTWYAEFILRGLRSERG